MNIPEGTFEQVRANFADTAVDIGPSEFYVPLWAYGIGGAITEPREMTGIIEYHREPDGRASGGAVHFREPGVPQSTSTWTVNSLDPLDIYPSVGCRTCPHHGWIRAGRWVPV